MSYLIFVQFYTTMFIFKWNLTKLFMGNDCELHRHALIATFILTRNLERIQRKQVSCEISAAKYRA